MSDVPKTIEEAVAEAKRYIEELCGRYLPTRAEMAPPYTVAISMAKTTAYKINEIAALLQPQR